MIICAGCDKPILDKFLMNVMEKSWHASCISCAECKTPLTDKCFSRDGKLYCKLDFFRQYGTKCAGCKNGISPNELVRKAKDQVYHLKCFNCAACKKQLLTGEELFILPDHKFLCRSDYMNSKYKDGNSTDNEDIDDSVFDNENMEGISETGDLSDKDTSFDGDIIGSPSHLEDTMKEAAIDVHNNNNNNQSEMSNSCGSDKDESNSVAEDSSGNKRRGPRTTIKAKQLEVLKAAFAATPKPTRHIREQLAAETGLNMRVIQVWFQNRRSKERRLKQMNTMGSRRPFFGRAPRRMRGSHMDDSPDMPPPYGFYSPDGQPDSFYSSIYQQYPQEFYPTQGTQQAPVSDVFLSTPEMPPLSHHQGIHDSLYIPEVMNQQNAELLVSQMDAGYQRSTVYNSMPHHPQPIESW